MRGKPVAGQEFEIMTLLRYPSACCLNFPGPSFPACRYRGKVQFPFQFHQYYPRRSRVGF